MHLYHCEKTRTESLSFQSLNMKLLNFEGISLLFPCIPWEANVRKFEHITKVFTSVHPTKIIIYIVEKSALTKVPMGSNLQKLKTSKWTVIFFPRRSVKSHPRSLQ